MKFKQISQIVCVTSLVFFGITRIAPTIVLANDSELKSSVSLEQATQYYLQGKYQQTIQILETSIPQIEEDLALAMAYNNLAAAYYKIGNLPAAIDNWNSAISLFEKTKSAEDYIKATISVSQAYVNLGLLKQAIPTLVNGIDTISSQPQFAQVEAIARGILGKAYFQNGQLESAISEYQSSLKLESNAIALVNLSKAYMKLAKQYQLQADTAASEFEETEAQNLEKLARQNKQLALDSAQNALKISEDRGINEAIAARIYLLSLLSDPSITSDSTVALFKQKSEYADEAIALLDRVPSSRFKAEKLVQIAKFVSDPQALSLLDRALKISEEIGDRRTLSFAHREIGRIYFEQKKYSQAIDDTNKGLLAAESAIASDNLFFLFWQLGQIETAQGEKEKAAKSYESALWNLRSPRRSFTVGRSNLFFQLRDRVNPFLRDYVALLLSGQPSQKQIQKGLDALYLLKISELQIFFNDPCFQDIVEILFEGGNISQLESTELSTRQIQIYSFVLPEQTYFILRFPDNSLKTYTLALTEQKLSERTRQFIYDLRDRKTQNYYLTREEIYNLLISPIERDIAAIDRGTLVFIHDGILRNIPMEALYDGRKYLVEKYPIIYRAGLRITATTTGSKNREALIFGLTEAVSNFPALPYVAEEIVAVQKIVGGDIFVDRDFTQSNFNQNIEQQKYSVLHIATHGVFGGSAQNSFLLTVDDKINLNEFNNILLNSSSNIDLLTLTACDTLPTSPLATLGFAGVAIRNRVENILGTLWSVNDRNIVSFIENFYNKVYQEELSLVEAKRQVQIELISQDLHPYNWAGVILINSQ